MLKSLKQGHLELTCCSAGARVRTFPDNLVISTIFGQGIRLNLVY